MGLSGEAAGAGAGGLLDAVVVGAGPAGLSAALQLVREGRKALVIERGRPGGQLLAAGLVENYPGVRPLAGGALARRFLRSAREAGVRVVRGEVLGLSGRGPFRVLTSGGVLRARVVVAATGAQPRGLWGLPSVYEVQDVRKYRGLRVAVIGCGDAALDSALRLRGAGARVTVFCRSGPRALPLLVERCSRAGVKVLHRSAARAVRRVGERLIVESDVGETEVDVALSAVGKEPRTGVLPLPIGRLRPHPLSGRTTVPGLYVVGDAASGRFRQVAVAAGMGVAAAMDAADFLRSRRSGRGVRGR
ncbi:MAG: NAD(P)/FAD-dependent oxidoreductase [Thermoplasmatota archaeon]